MNGNKPCGEDRESRWVPTRPGAATFGFGSTSKIRDVPVNRLAMVYVRQSTPQQVLENRESRERQYALAEFAQRLGWPAERVMVIDEDQGQSGKTATDRSGFQRLMTEVSLNHVGVVLGLELSRLSRSNKDWHQLIDVCGIFNTLAVDAHMPQARGDGHRLVRHHQEPTARKALHFHRESHRRVHRPHPLLRSPMISKVQATAQSERPHGRTQTATWMSPASFVPGIARMLSGSKPQLEPWTLLRRAWLKMHRGKIGEDVAPAKPTSIQCK
jgi:hypothetical protein